MPAGGTKVTADLLSGRTLREKEGEKSPSSAVYWKIVYDLDTSGLFDNS